MPVITISRQYASGGSDIAARVAARVTWTLIDNEFVDRVAELAGLTADEVARREERIPGLIERLASNLAHSSPEVFLGAVQPAADTLASDREMLRVTQTVIAEAVQHGNAVLVGRGAQAYLGEREDVLHVFVVAPLATRIRRTCERQGTTEREAAKMVTDIDEGRRHYVDVHYGRRWDDPANYDLVVNSGRCTYDQVADLVIAAARLRGWLS